jgi:hypothetical protein
VRNYDGDGRGGGEGVMPVGGILKDELDTFLAFMPRLAGARSERDFGRIADDAEAALRAFRVAKKPPADSVPWQEMVAKDPRPNGVIAREYKITTAYVWQLKKKSAT